MMAIPVRERVVAVIFGVLFACIALSAPALATSEKDAFEASKQLGTAEAWDAFLKSYPSGFHADLARAYLKKLSAEPAATSGEARSTDAAASAPVGGNERVTLDATAIPVGKWPERIAFDGRSLWVSESGARSIVEIDLETRRTGKRHKVGRLPVDMVVTENGTVYALAETDNTIYAAAEGDKRAGPFAEVPRCADIMAYASNSLFVVSNLNCSAPAVLTRVSHLNGRTSKLTDLAAGPADMKAAHGKVYVSHMGTGGRAAFVSIVDPTSGSAAATPDLPLHYPRLAANGSAVFAGGAPVDARHGVVVKIAAGNADRFAVEQRLPEPIAAIAATDEHVIAAGRNGTLFVLAARDLALQRSIATNASMEPHDVLVADGTLVIVSSKGSEIANDNVVYVIDSWMPGSAAAAGSRPAKTIDRDEADRPERVERVAEKRAPLKCGQNYKKVRGECVLLQNCGPNAYRSPEGDCYCDKGFDMKRGKCVARKEAPLKCGQNYKKVRGECVLLQNCGPNAYRSPEGDCYCNNGFQMSGGQCVPKGQKQPKRVDNCPGDSVLKNGKCVKEAEPEFKPPVKCTGGQLYSLSKQACACQDGLKWNGQRCYLP